jgi:hypothetical protein
VSEKHKVVVALSRRDIIIQYGSKCECCGEAEPEFLTIDHTKNDGAEHRRNGFKGEKLYKWLKDQGYPKDGYRLLCWNCNAARGIHGFCPHEASSGAAFLATETIIRRLRLPPRPTWDDQVASFMGRGVGFVCRSVEDFNRAKEIAGDGVRLKEQIEQSYAPVLDAIHAILDPITTRKKLDLGNVQAAMDAVDRSAIGWKRERDRIAKEEAEKDRQLELKRRQELADRQLQAEEDRKQRKVELAREWGDEDGAAAIEKEEVKVPEVVPPRAAKAEVLTYRKGARVKTKFVFKINNPDEVNRQYCAPDPKLIKAKIDNWRNLIGDPTKEQIAALEAEIGGGHIDEEG